MSNILGGVEGGVGGMERVPLTSILDFVCTKALLGVIKVWQPGQLPGSQFGWGGGGNRCSTDAQLHQ